MNEGLNGTCGNQTMNHTTVSNSVEEMEVEEESKDTYEPRKALEMAIHDWLPELYKAKSSFGVKAEKKEEEEEKDVELEDKGEGRKMEEDVSMATEEETRKKWSRKWEGSLYWEEVQMVCDFFYLPFEHGPMGEKMLNAAKWLVDHFHLVFHPDHNRYGAYLHTNTNPSYTQHASLPLTNTTAAILGASGLLHFLFQLVGLCCGFEFYDLFYCIVVVHCIITSFFTTYIGLHLINFLPPLIDPHINLPSQLPPRNRQSPTPPSHHPTTHPPTNTRHLSRKLRKKLLMPLVPTAVPHLVPRFVFQVLQYSFHIIFLHVNLFLFFVLKHFFLYS